MCDVLIVDDNAVVRQSLRYVLEEQKWSVAEAVSGRDGVQRAAMLQPAMVVLDFCLPDVNGIDAGAQIRRINPRIPVVLFTAYKDDFLLSQAWESGISLVIAKNEGTQRLVESLRLLIKYKGTAVHSSHAPLSEN